MSGSLPTQSEPRYTIRTYTGPPLYCRECGRDIKLTMGHMGTFSPAWPRTPFCDHHCVAWYGERQALRAQGRCS